MNKTGPNKPLDDELLTAYALGQLDGPERAEMEARLETSRDGRAAVEEIRLLGGLLREMNHLPCPAQSDDPTTTAFPAHTKIQKPVRPANARRGRRARRITRNNKPAPPADKGIAANKPVAHTVKPLRVARKLETGTDIADIHLQLDSRRRGWWSDVYSGWATSMIVHALLLVALGLWVLGKAINDMPTFMLTSVEEIDLEDQYPQELKINEGQNHFILKPITITQSEKKKVKETQPAQIPSADMEIVSELDKADGILIKDLFDPLSQQEEPAPVEPNPDPPTGQNDLRFPEGSVVLGRHLPDPLWPGKPVMTGRSNLRKAALRQSPFVDNWSENAVDLALNWLARHQYPDGGWRFDHTRAQDCNGRCPNPGQESSRNAATGLGLLPFLGAGDTIFAGKYQPTIVRAVNFLMRRSKNGSLMDEGRMYAHGIAALALIEAYTSRRMPDWQININRVPADKRPAKEPLPLRPAQVDPRQLKWVTVAAAKYIVMAQNLEHGGWRYKPGEPGDMSVVGWQVMALHVARMKGLFHHPLTIQNTIRWLESASLGSRIVGKSGPQARASSFPIDYQYMANEDNDKTAATRAIGLLCRIYLDMPRNHPATRRAAGLLAVQGPSASGNMYYNYYANQFMYQARGREFKRWNFQIRKMLTASQEKEGHLTGSWHWPADHNGRTDGGDHGANRAGRLYHTALASLCLEEFYRHAGLAAQPAPRPPIHLHRKHAGAKVNQNGAHDNPEDARKKPKVVENHRKKEQSNNNDVSPARLKNKDEE